MREAVRSQVANTGLDPDQGGNHFFIIFIFETLTLFRPMDFFIKLHTIKPYSSQNGPLYMIENYNLGHLNII